MVDNFNSLYVEVDDNQKKIEYLEKKIEYLERLIPDSVVKLNQSLTARVEALLEERGALNAEISALKDQLASEKAKHEKGRSVQSGLIESARNERDMAVCNAMSLSKRVDTLNKTLKEREDEINTLTDKLASRDVEIQLLQDIKEASKSREVIDKIDHLTEMVERQGLQMVEALKEVLHSELSSGIFSDVVDIIEKNKAYLIKSSAGKTVKKTSEDLDKTIGISRDIINGLGTVELGEKWFSGGASAASRKSSASIKKKNLEKSGVLSLVEAFDKGDPIDTSSLSKEALEVLEYLKEVKSKH